MKAITLHQPYASLIAIGAKRFETRRWRTLHRGPLAIHSAARMPPRMWDLFWAAPFYRHLKDAGFQDPTHLPRGSVVCVVDVKSCQQIAGAVHISADERAFGNWTPGRYAWELVNLRRFQTPIDAKGQQGLWEWKEQGHGH